jgi:hypothetical protein
LPYAGLKFYVYQSMKNRYRSWQIEQGQQQQQGKKQQQPQQQQQQQTVHQQEQHTEHHLPPPPPFETALQQAQVAEEEEEEQQKPQKLPVPITLLFGGVAGLVAQTVTYPLVRKQVAGATRVKAPRVAGTRVVACCRKLAECMSTEHWSCGQTRLFTPLGGDSG